MTAPAGTRPTRYRARVRFRDLDGVLRDVERFDRTKGRAETKLRAHLAERATPASGSSTLRPETSVEAAGRLWLAQVQRQDSGLSPRTRETYAGSFRRYVEGSTIAALSLREANRVPVLRDYLQGIADNRGSGAAHGARSVVSNILRFAVGDGVLPNNAMREVQPVRADVKRETVRDTTRALTRDERDHVLKVADEHERARRLDVTDLVWFMAGTGARISEALSLRWEDVNLDLGEDPLGRSVGTVLLRGTKSSRSVRELALPPWLVDRLKERALLNGTEGIVFPSPGYRPGHARAGKPLDKDKPRDRRNVLRVYREVLDEAGFPWATSHTLRRTVASLIDEAGLSIALAADVLGHADASMTARVYLGRKGSTAAAAAIL